MTKVLKSMCLCVSAVGALAYGLSSAAAPEATALQFATIAVLFWVALIVQVK